jgi:hypothetical protein
LNAAELDDYLYLKNLQEEDPGLFMHIADQDNRKDSDNFDELDDLNNILKEDRWGELEFNDEEESLAYLGLNEKQLEKYLNLKLKLNSSRLFLTSNWPIRANFAVFFQKWAENVVITF